MVCCGLACSGPGSSTSGRQGHRSQASKQASQQGSLPRCHRRRQHHLRSDRPFHVNPFQSIDPLNPALSRQCNLSAPPIVHSTYRSQLTAPFSSPPSPTARAPAESAPAPLPLHDHSEPNPRIPTPPRPCPSPERELSPPRPHPHRHLHPSQCFVTIPSVPACPPKVVACPKVPARLFACMPALITLTTHVPLFRSGTLQLSGNGQINVVSLKGT